LVGVSGEPGTLLQTTGSFMQGSSEAVRIIRFVMVGGVVFASYYGCMVATMSLTNSSQAVAAGAGFIVGTMVSYIGNSLIVFRARPTAGNMLRFWIVILAGLVLNVCIAFVLERLGFSAFFTALVIFLTVPVLNYLGHRFWSFAAVDAERIR
jgi:putative flippase GtrA